MANSAIVRDLLVTGKNKVFLSIIVDFALNHDETMIYVEITSVPPP
jgi:hypothetical protein